MKNLDYGIIGNCKSAALVNKRGGIDWCCLPDFDSSSFFAKILDKQRGGSFSVEPVGDYKITQKYLRKTNVLCTRFKHGHDCFEILDFMPRYKTESGKYHYPPDIIRLVRHISGSPQVRIFYDPQPAWARYDVRCTVKPDFIKHCTEGNGTYESLYLYTNFDHQAVVEHQPITIESDHYMVVSYNQKLVEMDIDWVYLEFERTKVYWMGWVAKTTRFSDYDQAVERSALVLKLLAYQKTGAILAAVTTSMPETIGEVRNWDYRYCWLRDASMTISVLVRLGHQNVAKRFLNFILNIVPYKDERVQIMYGINNQKELEEKELDWLDGYEGSRPVRIGNDAYHQKQNDIYGVVLDVIYQSLRYFNGSIDNREDLWTVVRTLTRHVRYHWEDLDSGIWEFRTDRKHFTFSKILCWVAMDRAVKIAGMLGRSEDALDYAYLRDDIKTDVLKHGTHPESKALTQYYGGDSLDSANLLAEHYGFIGARDPVYISTVRETYKRLCVDGLMYRYRDADDFGVPKSSFTVCTFWMIKSLHRIGEKKLAKELFEQLLTYSNHLGLFSEDIDFKTKRLLGNFPQGYSHLALIDTAMTLSGVPEWFEESGHFCP